MKPFWRTVAACRSYPTSWWFPTSTTLTDDNVFAQQLCGVCPVRTGCRAYARDHKVEGIWGGRVFHPVTQRHARTA